MCKPLLLIHYLNIFRIQQQHQQLRGEKQCDNNINSITTSSQAIESGRKGFSRDPAYYANAWMRRKRRTDLRQQADLFDASSSVSLSNTHNTLANVGINAVVDNALKRSLLGLPSRGSDDSLPRSDSVTSNQSEGSTVLSCVQSMNKAQPSSMHRSRKGLRRMLEDHLEVESGEHVFCDKVASYASSV